MTNTSIKHHYFQVIIFMLGIISILGGFLESLYFPKIAYVGLASLMVIGYLLYLSQGDKKKYQLIIKITLLICVCVLFIESTQLIKFFVNFKKVIVYDLFLQFDTLFSDQSLLNILPIFVFILLGLPIVHLIISLMSTKKHNLFKLMILLLLYFLPVFIRHTLTNWTSYCFIIFFIYEFLFDCCLQYQTHQKRLQMFLFIGLTVVLSLSHFLLEPNPIFKASSTTVLTNIAHWINPQYIGQKGANVLGASVDVDGSLPTDNITSNYGIALTVHSDHPFSSYLRGYSLAHYEDNQWEMPSTVYQSSYSHNILTSYFVDQCYWLDIDEYEVKVESHTNYQLIPYFSRVAMTQENDSYCSYLDDTLTWYDIEGMDFEEAVQTLDTSLTYQTDLINYSKYVFDEYMDVPEELHLQLSAFISSKAQGQNIEDMSVLELASFVKEAMQSETTYTLQAGQLPSDKDFVEYFLFENKKGSCTHYATTGALLLRELGVPTRFVKGFVVKKSDFIDSVANIRNNRSHAWIEMYVDGLGWIPYEMTPSSGNTIDDRGEMLDAPHNNTTTPTNQPVNNQNTQTNHQDTQTQNHQKTWLDTLLQYRLYIFSGVFIMAFFIGYRLVTKKYFFIQIKDDDTNQQVIKYYQRFQRMIRFQGTIDDEIEKLAYKAKFSQYHITKDEVQMIHDYHMILAKNIYHSLSWYKKLIFKFVYGYI